MSRIEAGIVAYTLSSDYYAQVGADFDTEAVDDAILAELGRTTSQIEALRAAKAV